MTKSAFSKTGQTVKDLKPVFAFNLNTHRQIVKPAWISKPVNPFRFSRPDRVFLYSVNGASMGVVQP